MNKVIKKQQAAQACNSLESLTKQDISDPTKSYSVSLTNILLVALSSLTKYMPSGKSKSTTIQFRENSPRQRQFMRRPGLSLSSQATGCSGSACPENNSPGQEHARRTAIESDVTIKR
jgi:hypothetical protein